MKNKPYYVKQTYSQRKTSRSYLLLLLPVFLLLLNTRAIAQLPNGFVLKKLTANNLNECVAMAHAPDGRIFLAERGGTVKVFQNGTLSTVHTVQTTTASEQGLLGIALHSSFATNGKCYIYYTNASLTRHYLDVLTISAGNQVNSSMRLNEFDQILGGLHNGGAMVFKDNHLYLCIGESSRPATAQELNTYMGKVLRLDENGQPAVGNPYYNTGVNRQQKSIWGIGMRNPWAMTMDPQSKKLYVANVGGGYEEIHDVTNPDPSKNYNFGWGDDNRSGPDQLPSTIYPTFAYNRNLAGWNAQTCAITTVAAFNPTTTNYPSQYRNKLYFSDWCTGWLRCLDLNNPDAGYQEFFQSGFSRILGLSTGSDGSLYYSEFGGNGNLWKIEYTLATTPEIVNQPLSQTVIERDQVTLSVTVNGTAPFAFQWQKNGVNIPGATSINFNIASAALTDGGKYRLVVTNEFGTVTSNEATLIVEPYNAPPIAEILTPSTTSKWSVGDIISYSGTATDEEDGTLPASAFNWYVDLWHKDCPSCGHNHSGPGAPDGVTSGSFVADNGGETSHNIWLRLHLIVKDSKGRIGRDSVDIYPNKVDITLQSTRPGLEMALGSGFVTPYTKTMVVNGVVTLVAVTPQTIGDSIFTFTSWEHGGAATQQIRIPVTNTTYKANYFGAFDDKKNLALNKPVYASTVLGGNSAIKAVDGFPATRWESEHKVDPQWIYVDLGAVYSINRVKILWENAMAKDYRIEISNDINNWGTPVKTVVGNNTATNEWAVAGTGRYVRIYGTSRTTVYGYSIFEFEVYGASSGSGNQSPSVSITAPANNATFTAPANITLTASASDLDGSISKVVFYNGAQIIAEATTSPYSVTWSGVSANTYSVTAKAIDNQNASTTSLPVTIVVKNANISPTVSISSPANNSVFTAPANITLTADASDSDGSVTLVEFYNGVQKIGEDATSPYSINWTTVGAGTYSITAKVIDNQNASTTSLSVTIVVENVNNPPTVSISSPANNSVFTAPANITLTADASDSDGSVTLVEFYNGGQKIGEDATIPYSVNWTNVAVGTYTITAKATDNQNAVTTSDAVTVIVESAQVDPNLALKKPIFASSIENDGTPVTGANDGFYDTRWSSQFSDPQWIYVDLGAAYNINRVKITWEAAFASNYQIEVSNDINNWGTPVKVVTGNTVTINEWNVVGTGRYVRIYGTTRATVYGYSIYELEVYGSAVVSNQMPTVSITSPANNSVYTAPANITLTANAADADGSVTLVEFYNGSQKIGEDASAPYSITWSGVAAGTYSVTAKATDNLNGTTTSAVVNVVVENVVVNVGPTVSITSPANNSVFTAPASITLSANASDSDGSVTLVEFYNGGQKIGEDASAPYSVNWTNVAAGTYTITAKATDNDGDFTISSSVTVSVEDVIGNVNLALKKPVYVSSIQNGGLLGNYAVDGMLNTRWSSAFADPQWIYVDLGATYNINNITIRWEYAKGKDYRIEVSNDINNWGTPVKVVTGNSASLNEWPVTATGRYVRIYGTARTTGYGYSIYELEVYGSSTAKSADLFSSNNTLSQEMSLYPNPISTEVMVKASFNTASPVNVVIVDASGFVVYDQNFENKTGDFEQLINVSELPKGAYVIKLFSGDQVFSQKMIKE